MKNLIFLLILLGCSFKISAQQTLAWYGFDFYGNTNPTWVDNSLISASPVTTAGNVNLLGFGPGISGLPSDMSVFFNVWPPQLVPVVPSEYVEFTISASGSQTIDLHSVTFYSINYAAFGFTMTVRSSLDGYTTNLYQHSNGVQEWHYHCVIVPCALSPSESITFRIYGTRNHSNAVLVLDSLFVNGGPASTLPIELLSFNAFEAKDDVEVVWTTASEQNNDYFIVERSDDVRDWQTIEVVEGAGNSQQMLHYSILDREAKEGLQYYRLSQVDDNGTSEVFDNNVVAVLVKARDGPVYPNPARVGQTVYVPPDSRVIDSLGRTLATSSGTFVPSTSGVYWVHGQPLVVE